MNMLYHGMQKIWYNKSMKVFDWNEIKSLSKTENDFFKNGSGISVGSFDGFHQGHRLLLDTLVKNCKAKNILSGAVSFKRPLPSLKHADDYKGDLTTLHQRLCLFEELGLDFVILVDFNDEFASISGVDFLSILVEQINAKYIAEGIDFRFGYKGSSDVSSIKYFAKDKDFSYDFVDCVYFKPGTDEEERVSSSYIRTMILKRFFATAQELLCRPYEIELSNAYSINEKKEYVFEKKAVKQVLPPDGGYQCFFESSSVRVVIEEDKIICAFEKPEELSDKEIIPLVFLN